MQRTSSQRRNGGFTLIELMIVLAIVAILATVAYPSYTRYVTKSNRVAAQAEMMDIANREQQFLLANRSYADASAIAATGYALPSSVSSVYSYSITLGTGTVPSFTVTFTPTGRQASDGPLTLNSEGVKAPPAKW